MAANDTDGVKYLAEFEQIYNRGISKILETVTVKEAQGASIVIPFVDRDAAGASVGRTHATNDAPTNSLQLSNVTITFDPIDSRYTASNLHPLHNQTGPDGIYPELMRSCVEDYKLKVEDKVIEALNSVNVGPTNVASNDALLMLERAVTLLKMNTVSGELYCAATPAFMASLRSNPRYSSRDYVDSRRFTGDVDASQMFDDYYGTKIYEISKGLPNSTAGSTDERIFVYSKSAVCLGQSEEMKRAVGVSQDVKQEPYAMMLRSVGVKVLQNSGVIELKFDGSNYNTSTNIT